LAGMMYEDPGVSPAARQLSPFKRTRYKRGMVRLVPGLWVDRRFFLSVKRGKIEVGGVARQLHAVQVVTSSARWELKGLAICEEGTSGGLPAMHPRASEDSGKLLWACFPYSPVGARSRRAIPLSMAASRTASATCT
jgi:hypothetical protein